MGNSEDLKHFENFIIDSNNPVSLEVDSDLYSKQIYKRIIGKRTASIFSVLLNITNLALVALVILVIGIFAPVVKRIYDYNQKIVTVENILKDIDNSLASLDQITSELNEDVSDIIENY